MRDSKRIDVLCEKLAELWHTVPDWRFGQFVYNFMRYLKSLGIDIFYLEDEKCMKALQEFVQCLEREE